MSTPHRGTPVASAYAHSLLRPTEDLKMLKIESAINRQLHEDFCKIVADIPIVVTMLEMRETRLLGTSRMIVPQDSGAFMAKADDDIQHVGTLYHIDEHHHNICKPADKQSQNYWVILNFVKDAVRLAGQAEK